MLDITQLDIRPGTPRAAVGYNTVNSEFAELVYADQAWLDAEFDAIMAANFDALVPRPCPPPRSPHSWPDSAPWRGRHGPRYADADSQSPNAVRSGRSNGRRERSPPEPGTPAMINEHHGALDGR
jgi:hypothetical protein